jgi:hypothetical protein
MKFDPEMSLGGLEDQSTHTNSNNLDQNSKKRRTTSGGASFYMGSNNGQQEDGGCFEPSPWAVYQADLYGFDDMPKWYPFYYKNNRQLVQKVRAFSWGNPIAPSTIQSSFNINWIM